MATPETDEMYPILSANGIPLTRPTEIPRYWTADQL